MLFRTLFFMASLGLALSADINGQGDDCSSATPIQGVGSWTFDNSMLSDSGYVGSTGCDNPIMIQADGFYQWTAALDGDYEVRAQSTVSPVGFKVYSGLGCVSDCVDSAYAYGNIPWPKVFLVDVSMGDTFLFQLGNMDQATGNLTFEVAPFSDPCATGPDDFFEDNDYCSSARPVFPGVFTNLVATVVDPDYYSIVVPANHNLVVEWESDNPYGLDDIDGVLLDSGCNEIMQGPWDLGYTNSSSVSETIVFGLSVDDFYGQNNCASYSMDVVVEPNHCLLGTEDFLEDNDTCATAIPLVSGTYTGLRVHQTDKDFFEVVIPPLHSYLVHVINTERSTILSAFDDACTPVSGVTGTIASGHNSSHVNSMVRVFGLAPGNGGPFSDCAGYDFDVNVYANRCLDFPDDGLGGADCASAPSLLDGTYPALAVSSPTKDHYRFCVGDGVTLDLDVLFSHAEGNVDLVLWMGDAALCDSWNPNLALQLSESVTDDESLSWTNESGGDLEVVLQVKIAGPSVFTCNDYDLVVYGANNCGISSSFCSIPVLNSSGHVTLIDGFKGNTPGSGLHLEATGGPPFEFGYFIVGSEFAHVGVPLSNGQLCLSMLPNDRIGRYNVSGTTLNSIGFFNSIGRFVGLAGNSTTVYGFDIPGTLPFGGAVAAGETWHFQLWHRDTGAGIGASNLSDALHVPF